MEPDQARPPAGGAADIISMIPIDCVSKLFVLGCRAQYSALQRRSHSFFVPQCFSRTVNGIFFNISTLESGGRVGWGEQDRFLLSCHVCMNSFQCTVFSFSEKTFNCARSVIGMIQTNFW